MIVVGYTYTKRVAAVVIYGVDAVNAIAAMWFLGTDRYIVFQLVKEVLTRSCRSSSVHLL